MRASKTAAIIAIFIMISVPLASSFVSDDSEATSSEGGVVFGSDSTTVLNTIMSVTWIGFEVTVDAQYEISLTSFESTVYYAVKGSDTDVNFRSNVVDANKTDFNVSDYPGLITSVEPTSTTTYNAYTLTDEWISDGNVVTISCYSDDSGYKYLYSISEFLSGDPYRIYVQLGSAVSLKILYDDVNYDYYLKSNSEKIMLENGTEYTLNVTVSTEYYIYAVLTGVAIDELHATCYASMSGVYASDDNGETIAICCIAICVIVFGLLLISGRKPRWSKKG